MSTQLEQMRRYLGARGGGGAPGPRNVVVVGGGKGGAGASTVAALVAAAATARGRVLLVDAGDDAGTLRLLLGLGDMPGLEALRGTSTTVLELTAPLAERLDFLPATAADAPLGSAEHRALYRRAAAAYAGYDLVVVDAGSRMQSIAAACDAGAGIFLAVAGEDRIASAATYALVKLLAQRSPALPVEVVVNRAAATASPAYEAIRSAAAGFLQRTIALAGTIPDDPAVRAAAEAGAGISALARGAAAAAASEIADRIVPSLAGAGGPGAAIPPQRKV